MTKLRKLQTWIETGYDLFAKEGLEGIQVERLARILNLNKSGFYHYFGDRDIFLTHLMQYHIQMANQIIVETERIQSYDPEYLNLMVKYKTTVIVHMQLVRNRHQELFANTFAEINQKIDRVTLPLWAELVGLSDNPILALRYYEIVRDMFYARVTFETLHYDFLHTTALEAKALVSEWIRAENRNGNKM